MAYAITFPIINKRRQNLWSRLGTLFNYDHRAWVTSGSLTLSCEAITVRFDDHSCVFPIARISDLRLYYWSYDKESGFFPGVAKGTLVRMILDKGNNNYIDFECDGRKYSFEFYIQKKVYVGSLKKILKCWYEKQYSFSEYFGKLESYLLQHKHILERKRNERGESLS